MESYIKKSTLIREFKNQTKAKNKKQLEKLDKSFFLVINRICKHKPLDVKFHLTEDNSLAFNIDYPNNKRIYIEHFIDKNPDTLVSVTMSNQDFNTQDDIFRQNLSMALDNIERILIKDVTNTGEY